MSRSSGWMAQSKASSLRRNVTGLTSRGLQLTAYFLDDFFRRSRHLDYDRVLGFLEVRKLARQNRGPGEVAVTSRDVLKHLLVGTFQVHNSCVQTRRQGVTVLLLERRTGQHNVFAQAGAPY